MSSFSSEEPPVGAGAPTGWLPSNAAEFGATPGSREMGLHIEPTIGAVFSHAWNILKADFWGLLLIGFVAWLLGAVVGSALGNNGGNGGGALSLLYQYLVGNPIFYGAAYAWLRAARGEKPQVGDLFVPFQRRWLACVAAQILVTIALIVGFILLVIPGIFLAVRLAFVPFLVVDEGRGPVEALTESFNRTSGFSWTIFGAGLVAILVFLVGLVLLVIGSIPATMLDYLAFASLYAAITARKSASSAAA